MKIEKNVGRLDSLMRIGIGFTVYGCGILRKSDAMIIFGSKKLAEGLTRFCVGYHLLGITTVNDKLEFKNKQSAVNLDID